jgi:glycosyltransferase involved in cell wall biosynthesis
MKVLIVARLFTGLAESVRDGSWAPRGVPAIYKLIEHLHADPSVELKTVLTVKDDLGAWSREDRRVTFREVGETLVFGSRGLSGLLREMAHMFQVLLLVVRWRPDVCYVTNANFIPASLVARFRLAPVVMRFLGLHPEQKRIARGESRLQGWFYRAPFARAVCSLDGSGGKAYLPDLLSAKVPITVLLNGVDRAPVDRERTAELRRVHGLGDRPVVLFVGRLESNKGILEFVAACRTVLDRTPGAMDVVVAGDGALLQEAEASAGSAGIRFLGAVDHGDVSALLSLADK